MLSRTVVSVGIPLIQPPFPETIQSRFGEITVDASRSIEFPRGLLGMPDKYNFVLTNFNSKKMEQFKLLQSLDEFQLSFITLPIAITNNVVAEADIRAVADDLEIDDENLLLLLIVSVHRSPDSVRLSVNARAPLFLDAKQKLGVQYVFHNDSYKVQHYL